jgi:hypothetical protein
MGYEARVVSARRGPHPSAGSALPATQLHGTAVTVSAIASATGGIGPGKFIQTDIQTNLQTFKTWQKK